MQSKGAYNHAKYVRGVVICHAPSEPIRIECDDTPMTSPSFQPIGKRKIVYFGKTETNKLASAQILSYG